MDKSTKNISTKSYHHGGLRESLIEEGIRQMNSVGFENLSLRKIATACGVSNAAPYRHFKDKDDLLDAMQSHFEQRFTHILRESISESANPAQPMIEFGKAYVVFFADNPEYFAFFTRQHGDYLAISDDVIMESSYGPFCLFREQAAAHLTAVGVPEQAQSTMMLGMWSLVHGLASMAVMPGVEFDGDWSDLTYQVLMGTVIHG